MIFDGDAGEKDVRELISDERFPSPTMLDRILGLISSLEGRIAPSYQPVSGRADPMGYQIW